MNLLLPDRSVSRRDSTASIPIRVISTLPAETDLRVRARWVLVFGLLVLASFGGGFAVSSFVRSSGAPLEPKIQIADFRVQIPQGETTVTITGRDQGEQLGEIVINRVGNSISGIPETARRIAAREPLNAADAAFFRHELAGVFSKSDSDWERANKIRRWLVAKRYRMGMPGLTTRIPREAYEQMAHGAPVLCGNLAEIYVALCEAAGLTARSVGLSVAVQEGLFGIDTHAGAEVWIPEMGGWIYQDPTFDCYWEVEGKPASALMLHEAVMGQRQIRFAPHEREVEERLRSYYIDPRLYFRQISYEYKAGGSVLYFADKRLEPLSLRDKNWVHTSDAVDIQRLDTNGHIIRERRWEIAPGVFGQLLGNDLFIRDRRQGSAGIRVRSSTGTVEGCAYLHQRAEDLGLFAGMNLARNPSFRLTNRSNQLADGWSVLGPVEAMTVSGGQAMSALAGGRLWQRIQARPHGRYLLYARVSVVRGLVNWSIADSTRRARSMGTVEPERISEVVSDVVESESGYLDVSFEVPSGGAFRVMDVIVTEAPRFDPAEELTTKAQRH